MPKSAAEANGPEPQKVESTRFGNSETSSTMTSEPPKSGPRRPLVRRGILNLLLATLVSIAVVAYFWDSLDVWRKQGRAQELFRTYQDAAALEELRAALAVDHDNPATVIQLARAHRRLGNLEKAMMLVDTSAKLGADVERVELERKLLALQTGQISGFEKELPDMLVERADDASDILQAYVLGLFANLRTEEAFSLLEGWEQSSPKDPQPKFLQAYLYQGINRLDLATEAYRQGLLLAPMSTLMRRRLAQVLLDAGELEAAKAELTRCEKEDPQDVEVIFLQAQCAFAEQASGDALADLDRVLEVVPTHVDALLLRGQIRLANGDPQSALADLQFVADRQADDTVAREALGRTLQALGRAAEAKPHFDFVSSATKEQAETVRLIRQVIEEPDNVELRFEIGMRLLQMGTTEDGAKWMRTVLEIQPAHPGAHLALAEYYQLRGDMQAAMVHQQAAGQGAAPQ